MAEKAEQLAKYEKRGYLIKRGQVRQNWLKRYFVLKDGALFYYEKPTDLRPRGQLNLFGGAAVFVRAPKVDKPNCLEVSTPERTLYVYAETAEEIKDWAVAIQKAAIISSGGKLRASGPSDGAGAGLEAKKQASEGSPLLTKT